MLDNFDIADIVVDDISNAAPGNLRAGVIVTTHTPTGCQTRIAYGPPTGTTAKQAKDEGFIRVMNQLAKGQRPEDQPLPVVNDEPFVHDLVAADIAKRGELGKQRYGTKLQPHNGRNMLLDAYEEALDLVVYLKGALMEAEAERSPSGDSSASGAGKGLPAGAGEDPQESQ